MTTRPRRTRKKAAETPSEAEAPETNEMEIAAKAFSGAEADAPEAAADAEAPAEAAAEEAAPGSDEPAVIALDARLDINAAAPLAERLVALRGRPVTLDGTDVKTIGGQCFQVLLAAMGTWEADSVAFTVGQPSEDMIAGLTLLGLPSDTLARISCQ